MPLNVINYTPLVEADGTVSAVNRILGTVRFGQSWYKEIQAQETVISLLRKLLSDRFTLVRNFTLPDEEIPIPILLISGSGIWMLAVTDTPGIFKTNGKELLEMDSKTHEFAPAKNNLVMRTLLLSRAFEDFLLKNNVTIPPVEPVLIFTNPGVDVTTGDASIRVLLIDALNRFVTSLTTTPIRMEVGTSKRIIELIKAAHEKSLAQANKKSEGVKLKFSTNQKIILGGMLLFLFFSFILLIFILINI